MEQGATVALVSDAGMPLVSDPGFRLVSLAFATDFRGSDSRGLGLVTALAASACQRRVSFPRISSGALHERRRALNTCASKIAHHPL